MGFSRVLVIEGLTVIPPFLSLAVGVLFPLLTMSDQCLVTGRVWDKHLDRSGKGGDASS